MEITEVCGFKDSIGRFHETKVNAINANYRSSIYSAVMNKWKEGICVGWDPSARDAIDYILDHPEIINAYQRELADNTEPIPPVVVTEKKWWKKLWKDSKQT